MLAIFTLLFVVIFAQSEQKTGETKAQPATTAEAKQSPQVAETKQQQSPQVAASKQQQSPQVAETKQTGETKAQPATTAEAKQSPQVAESKQQQSQAKETAGETQPRDTFDVAKAQVGEKKNEGKLAKGEIPEKYKPFIAASKNLCSSLKSMNATFLKDNKDMEEHPSQDGKPIDELKAWLRMMAFDLHDYCHRNQDVIKTNATEKEVKETWGFGWGWGGLGYRGFGFGGLYGGLGYGLGFGYGLGYGYGYPYYGYGYGLGFGYPFYRGYWW
jgi:hypothetical protein